MHKPLQIIKLGGSLLSLSDLPQRLAHLIDSQPGYAHAIVVGGGEAANVVRQWDLQHALSSHASHDLAVQSLKLTAQLLTELLPAAGIANRRDAVRIMIAHHRLPVVDVAEFLERYESETRIPLPHDWSLTSDSLALWISHVLKADQLLIAKSIDRPENQTLEMASATGALDAHFPWLWRKLNASECRLKLKWVNLRSKDFQATHWNAQSLPVPPVLPQSQLSSLLDEHQLCRGLSW